MLTSAPGFAGTHLHHDFASTDYGIPYTVVDSRTTPFRSILVPTYTDESDVVAGPFPSTGGIEGAPSDCVGWPVECKGDAHMLVLDRATCFLYETFNTHRYNGSFAADGEAIFDMINYNQRPVGWSSADAAGLSIFTGLIR